MCDEDSLGLCLSQLTSPIAVRECTDCVCAAGLFLLLKAAELSRERQKEIMVVQLDVKKLLDHVEHPTAFKAMRLRWL